MSETAALILDLIRKRGQIKSQLTCLEKALDTVEADANAKFDHFDCEGRLEKHKALWAKYEEIETSLFTCEPDEATETLYHEERISFENRYFAINGRINALIKSHCLETNREIITVTPQVSTESNSNAGNGNSTNAAPNSNDNSASSSLSNNPVNLQNSHHNFLLDPNLPKLGLPSFAGTFDTWLGFRDIFTSMVHENTQVPTIFKFLYLKSCVTNEANEVINSLQTSEENYEIAWKLLNDRYDNRKLIAENHMKAIFDCPSISKEFSIRSLLDTILKHTRALRALKQPVDNWDLPLIHIIKQKLNNHTRERWEEFTGTSKVPTMNDMIKFLERRSQIDNTRTSFVPDANKLNISRGKSSPYRNSQPSRAFHNSNAPSSSTPLGHSFQNDTRKLCLMCKGEHAIYQCKQFLNLSPQERINEVKKASVCFNCLGGKHRPADCRLGGCRQCHKKHNTLLHIDMSKRESPNENDTEVVAGTSINTLHTSSEVYLGTAIVDVCDAQGNYQTCRVMLDGGAQSCAITDRCASRLGLVKNPIRIPLLSINDIRTNIEFETSVTIRSRFNKRKQKLNLLIVNIISNTMPSLPVSRDNIAIPNNMFLADPKFNESAPVDMLIGAEFVYSFLLPDQLAIRGHSAVLQKTILGWVVAGRIYNTKMARNSGPKQIVCNLLKNPDLPILWELENVKTASLHSKEEQICEQHYESNVRRDIDGRYVVKLPFNEKIGNLGDSRNMAVRRFYSLEKRFDNDSSLRQNYANCINDYITQNHMIEISDENNRDPGFYLPHLAVIKNNSVTTKTRVVFDASAKSSTGISLNDCLMTGPTIQDNLFSIVIRFRSFLFALTADIEQMYRQIKVNPDDINYQKVLWRNNKTEKLKVYALNRVTFGTAAAPYLATRTLLQLAQDEAESHPQASIALKRDFYVDDLLTGSNSFNEALILRDELIQLLNKAGFNLRKWASNDSRLTNNFSENSVSDHMSLDPTETIKTLGIFWEHKTDSIFYTVNLADSNDPITKRSVLSESAKLFDPLGLVGPVIVSAKILLQSLWKLKIDWDDPIPPDLAQYWSEYKKQLPLLNNFRTPRCITVPKIIETQIHGFCDASERAYGACLYLRSTDSLGNHHCVLICAKSRVAPLKIISIPKLELCAALLLTNLLKSTLSALNTSIDQVFLWSDSTIVLSWIKTEPNLLKTFVANRVAEIQSLSQSHKWSHVPTLDNPADLISRGQTPVEFLQSIIWQHGLKWLTQSANSWPQSAGLQKINDLPETKNLSIPLRSFSITISRNNANNTQDNLLERYSSLRTLKHVVAYCQRFINNCKTKIKAQRSIGPLSIDEVKTSMHILLKITQASAFNKEMSSLSKGEVVDKKSSLICLNPFLEQGIIKVGGRLEKANIPYTYKHPIVLPRNHHITTLIIREEHIKRKHAGTQATLYGVREFYWPIDGRNSTRKIIHACVKCFHAKPRESEQMMGNLPEQRVSFSRPFLNTGVDYCGPFFIKEKRHRNRGKEKAYVCVFVCLATKAVHLELVCDLTTETFIASLSRFFSRRGKAENMYSDNGTNFVGANKELKELFEILQKTEQDPEVKRFLLKQQVNWHFNPPRAPHFGGLWEASVKSIKFHLMRTVGKQLLTYEQLQTYLIEIEAILNSRPLTPMSSDPNDLLPLTPAHFLVGGSLSSFPQADVRSLPVNRLSAWQYAQQIKQHFWSRWYKEYLNEMTTRSKWKNASNQDQLKEGALVVEKEDNLPPLCWKLARIVKTHPGSDGQVHVVTIKNANGSYKRCIKKLCPLPIVQA